MISNDEQLSKIIALRKAIQQGRDSGVAEDFDAVEFLTNLKERTNPFK
nr:type II toxin-antitoxin system ParD family antitoxin [uncultured Flavobacterium sp.]